MEEEADKTSWQWEIFSLFFFCGRFLQQFLRLMFAYYIIRIYSGAQIVFVDEDFVRQVFVVLLLVDKSNEEI